MVWYWLSSTQRDGVGWGELSRMHSPYPQHASLNGVRGKVRNLPCVRGELALHIHPIMIDNSGRCKDHLGWVRLHKIFFDPICPLGYQMGLVCHAFDSLNFASTCAVWLWRVLFFVLCSHVYPFTSAVFARFLGDKTGHTFWGWLVAGSCFWTPSLVSEIIVHDTYPLN